MRPQWEANKKQHLQHWEESMHLIVTQLLILYIIFLVKLFSTVKTNTNTDYASDKSYYHTVSDR